MMKGERLDGQEPISPELALIDPELRARVRAAPIEQTAPAAQDAPVRRLGWRLKGLLASAVVAAGLGGLASLAIPTATSPAAAQYQYGGKVTICHHTHSQTNPFLTIVVSQSAVPAHLGTLCVLKEWEPRHCGGRGSARPRTATLP
jgi:hypothetical protein